jgi:hypothetical protein
VQEEKKEAVKMQQYMWENAMAIQGWELQGALALQPYVKDYYRPGGITAGMNFNFTRCWLDK